MRVADVKEKMRTAENIISASSAGLDVVTFDDGFLLCQNHVMSMMTPVAVPGSFTVKAEPLLKFIKSAPDVDLVVDVDSDPGFAKFSASRFRTKMPLIENHLIRPKIVEGESFAVERKQDLVSAVMTIVKGGLSIYWQSSVSFADGRVSFFGPGAKVFCWVDVDQRLSFEALVPWEVFNVVKSVASEFVDVVLSPRGVSILWPDGSVLTSSLVNGNFPDATSKLVDLWSDPQTRTTQEFADAFNRVSSFGNVITGPDHIRARESECDVREDLALDVARDVGWDSASMAAVLAVSDHLDLSNKSGGGTVAVFKREGFLKGIISGIMVD